jgi:hypothetical protein
MRFRLRTLMIAAALGPPLLALAWFLAVWARFVLPKALDHISGLAWPSMLAAVGLAVFSVAASPPGSQPAAAVSPGYLSLLGGTVFVALAQWLWVYFGLVGWLFVWGENGPPYPERVMALFPVTVALCCTLLTGIRIHVGLATVNYVFILWCLAAPLALLTALYWISFWLR